MAVPVQYQNPNSVNVALVLDAEQVSVDSTTGTSVPVEREFVVPQESVSGSDPWSRLLGFTEQMLDELKKIRVLLEQDAPPGLADDVMDEAQNT